MSANEFLFDQASEVDSFPWWREWLPSLAQIRYAAELKLDLAIDGLMAQDDRGVKDAAPDSAGDLDVGNDAVVDMDDTDDESDPKGHATVPGPATRSELPATSMRQGMGLVIVVGLLAGFLPFLLNWVTATQAGTSVALAGLAQSVAGSDQFARDLFPALAAWLDAGATLGGLEPIGPGWLAAFMSALGLWISWPLNALTYWIVYGLGVLVVAKLLGAPTTLQRFYAGVSYATVPLLLLALTPIPCIGGLLALIVGIWSLTVYVLAVRVVTDFDTLRAFVSVVAPAVIVLLITVFVAGATIASLVSLFL
jgi:hypothetical protein